MIGAFTGKTLASADTEGFAASFGSMASAFGNNVWQIVALVIGIIILMFGVGRGIEKANKIMMPVFFILFAVLGIYVAFQPGAIEGYKYIFRVDPNLLTLRHGYSLLARHSSLFLLLVMVLLYMVLIFQIMKISLLLPDALLCSIL